MERNADDTFGATGDQGSTTGGSRSFGTQGQGWREHDNPPAVSDYSSSSGDESPDSPQTSKVDQAKAGARTSSARRRTKRASCSRHSPIASTRVRKSCVSATRIDALPTPPATGSSVAVASDDRMAQVKDSVARGMHKSADWLRNGDLKADIEQQVRENPGRTLLIALGVGYLLGKAFRGDRR